MKVSIALKINQTNTGGTLKCSEGDIVAVMPADHQWGTEEVKRYLIAEVDLPVSSLNEAKKLALPLFENDVDYFCTANKDETGYISPKVISKHKYFLPLEGIPVSLDMVKLRDTTKAYQPLVGTTLSSDLIKNKFNNFKIDLTKINGIG